MRPLIDALTAFWMWAQPVKGFLGFLVSCLFIGLIALWLRP